MIRLGIIGTGRIAQRFLPELKCVEGIQAAMAYNPHRESAERFAREFSIPGYTDDLAEMYGRVDAVYIASPHATHASYVRQMLEQRIHVLCEKPLSFSGEEAEGLFTLAPKRGCILLEAVKTAFCPGFVAMMEIAGSGRIGTVQDVEACFSRITPTNTREMTDQAFGGSFTELGSYPLLSVFRLLGTDYRSLEFKSIPMANGLDGYTKASLEYENGLALAKTGLAVKSEGQLVIAGTKGYILAPSPWWLTREFEVRYEDPGKREVYQYPFEGQGLRYEIAAFRDAILKGKAEIGPTEAESIGMAEVMERFLSRRRETAQTAPRDTGDRAKGTVGLAVTQDTGDRTKETVGLAVSGMEWQLKGGRKKQNMKIWAHRGCSMAYPENTLEAFQAAAELTGLTGIELDVQMTRDGQLVVIHDERADRTTNGVGLVKDYTLRQLKELRINAGNGRISRIPTLEEVFGLLEGVCRKDGIRINIELKNSVVRYSGMEEKILALVEAYHLEPYVVYSSFLPESVKLLKELAPDVQTGVLCVELEDCIQLQRVTRADALHPYVGGLHGRIPKELHGMPVRAWNGEEPFFGDGRAWREKELTRFAAFGVTEIFTNAPEWYLASE